MSKTKLKKVLKENNSLSLNHCDKLHECLLKIDCIFSIKLTEPTSGLDRSLIQRCLKKWKAV